METEAAIELAILKHLNAREDCLAFKYGVKARQGKGRSYTSNGVSDIVVNLQIAEMCFVIYMEVKNKKGLQRPSQFEFQKSIEALSGYYYIVRSVDEAEAALKDAKGMIESMIQIAQIPW